MKVLFKLFASLVLFAIAGFGYVTLRFSHLSNQKIETKEFSIDDAVASGDIALGKRIYTVRSACIECHGSDLSGKKVMDHPAMGSIYGPNISLYGLKDWSNYEIARAIRYGVGKFGVSLNFMPSFDFTHLSRSDIGAVIAYIRSMPPVEKATQKSHFGPMAQVLSVMGQMPVMFPAREIDQFAGFSDKPEEGPTKEFGAYLAKDCRGCHGPTYTGGNIPGGDPTWPPAANIRLGGDKFWTQTKFNLMLATGISPKTGEKIRAPMPIETLKKYNDIEKTALWLYLSSLM